MSFNVPTAINDQTAGEIANEETPATTTEAGHGNCSGSAHQGCCGNHRQEDSSNNHHSAKGCCGH